MWAVGSIWISGNLLCAVILEEDVDVISGGLSFGRRGDMYWQMNTDIFILMVGSHVDFTYLNIPLFLGPSYTHTCSTQMIPIHTIFTLLVMWPHIYTHTHTSYRVYCIRLLSWISWRHFCLLVFRYSVYFLLLIVDVTPKRHLYYNGSSHPITIETSDRPSHQLVSRILRTLLVDVLGYSDVRIRDGYNALNATKTLQRLSG